MATPGGSRRAAFEAGVRCFDAGAFFEAHERFEEVWRSPETAAEDRAFWKGVTQAAVAWCHVTRGNARGAVTLARRAVESLRGYPSPHLGVYTGALVAAMRSLADAVEARGCRPPPPRLPFPVVAA
jgi:predicted metal-dependent hydrolase